MVSGTPRPGPRALAASSSLEIVLGGRARGAAGRSEPGRVETEGPQDGARWVAGAPAAVRTEALEGAPWQAVRPSQRGSSVEWGRRPGGSGQRTAPRKKQGCRVP